MLCVPANYGVSRISEDMWQLCWVVEVKQELWPTKPEMPKCSLVCKTFDITHNFSQLLLFCAALINLLNKSASLEFIECICFLENKKHTTSTFWIQQFSGYSQFSWQFSSLQRRGTTWRNQGHLSSERGKVKLEVTHLSATPKDFIVSFRLQNCQLALLWFHKRL